jgi:hypothetical protein
MGFQAESVEVVGKTRNGVKLKLKGTESWQEGQYTNERNASKDITISEHKARQIRDALDEILDDDGDFDDGGTIIS